MNKLIYIFFVFILLTNKTFSQQKEITAIAELIKIKDTGKRHNSTFFTFKIKKVLSGKINDSIITFQEIYADFGATAIFSKLYPGYRTNGISNNKEAEEVIIKFYSNQEGNEIEENFTLKWVAEKFRRYRLQGLERLLNKKSSNNYNLLEEEGGKLFFLENGIGKVAVETLSGYWLIATFENQK